MKIKEINKLFLIYIIAHGLSLGLIYAQFYDDIPFLNWDKEVLIFVENQKNIILDFSLHVILFLRSLRTEIYFILSFFLFFFSALVFNKIVNLFYPITKETGYLLTVFYLILPFGLVKFSLSVFFYLLCIFCFLLGWYFIIRSRILSLFFFFISFSMQSLLVLYSLPIISYFFYKKKKQLFCVKEFFLFLINNIYFIILPFIFFFIKFFFYKPIGYYENYNVNYNVRHLFSGPILQFLDLFRGNLSVGFLIFGCLVGFLILKYIYTPINNYKKKNNINKLIPIIGLISSLFPYWIIGLIPTFSSFSSRHQLLLLISMPLFIIFFLSFFKKKYFKIFVILIVSLSLSINFKIYSEYYIEYLKQKKLITYLSDNKNLFYNNNVIIMNDKMKNTVVGQPNNNNQLYNNGIFKRALKNEKNFVININEIDDYTEVKLDNKFNGFYLATQHKRQYNNDIIILTIESEGFLKFVFSHRKILLTEIKN
jgi:hypothetical protein